MINLMAEELKDNLFIRCPKYDCRSIVPSSKPNSIYKCRDCGKKFTYPDHNSFGQWREPWWVIASAIALKGDNKNLSYSHIEHILNCFLNLGNKRISRDFVYRVCKTVENEWIKDKDSVDYNDWILEMMGKDDNYNEWIERLKDVGWLKKINWGKLWVDILDLEGSVWGIRHSLVGDGKKDISVTCIIGLNKEVKSRVILGSSSDKTEHNLISNVLQAAKLAILKGAPRPRYIIFSDIDVPNITISNKIEIGKGRNKLVTELAKFINLEENKISYWEDVYKNEPDLHACIEALYLPNIFSPKKS